MTQPRLIARLKITNGEGTFDSLSTIPGDEPIRIAADVDKSLEQTPNTATIRMWNPAPKTVDQIQGTVRTRQEWTTAQREELRQAGLSAAPVSLIYDNAGQASVELAWGYEGAAPGQPFPPLSTGFVGGSYSMEVEDDGIDSVLVIKAEDAGQLLTAARLNQSYSSGTDTVTIVVDLINAMGLTVNEASVRSSMETGLLRRGIPIGQLQQIGGYNASQTPAADQLRAIMTSLDLRWSVQDGTFLLLDRDGVLPGYAPIILSAATSSLFGNPRRMQDQRMSAVTWANAEIRPGREVALDAENLAAVYRVDRVAHSIDTDTGGTSTPVLDEIQTIPGVF